ncbi:MAG: hypothetical protein MK180_06960 [Rhodobacteraceae bacterium]|nr:hypothetical protein [Paracoccaceae bacterium]
MLDEMTSSQDWEQGRGATADGVAWGLVAAPTCLEDLERVERHLPEILGRALARSWIDAGFSKALQRDPKRLLQAYGVTLPRSVELRIEGREGARPRIVVSEVGRGFRPRRLMYLQLVMVAGR